MTTGITGFDGTISFEGDELPYGSYRITEQSPPDGYVKSSRVETVEWDGTKDVLITLCRTAMCFMAAASCQPPYLPALPHRFF